jgi:hypothetical protein
MIHRQKSAIVPPEQVTVINRIEREKKLMLEQLKKTPIVQIACEKVGIARWTYYRWRKEDPAFRTSSDESLQEGTAFVNDMAESQLLASLRDGNFAAVTFWLKHHHPSYSTKLEMKAIVEHRDAPLTPEQEAQIRRALKMAGIQ